MAAGRGGEAGVDSRGLREDAATVPGDCARLGPHQGLGPQSRLLHSDLDGLLLQAVQEEAVQYAGEGTELVYRGDQRRARPDEPGPSGVELMADPIVDEKLKGMSREQRARILKRALAGGPKKSQTKKLLEKGSEQAKSMAKIDKVLKGLSPEQRRAVLKRALSGGPKSETKKLLEKGAGKAKSKAAIKKQLTGLSKEKKQAVLKRALAMGDGAGGKKGPATAAERKKAGEKAAKTRGDVVGGKKLKGAAKGAPSTAADSVAKQRQDRVVRAKATLDKAKSGAPEHAKAKHMLQRAEAKAGGKGGGKKAAPAAKVQTGKKGGRYIITSSGAKHYIGKGK